MGRRYPFAGSSIPFQGEQKGKRWPAKAPVLRLYAEPLYWQQGPDWKLHCGGHADATIGKPLDAIHWPLSGAVGWAPFVDAGDDVNREFRDW